MNNDSFSLIFLALILIALIILFVRIALRIRKNGGSITTTFFAATYEFYHKEKRAAIEHIVEVKAHKKMEEQSSGQQKENLIKK
jgi:hypothetical protein